MDAPLGLTEGHNPGSDLSKSFAANTAQRDVATQDFILQVLGSRSDTKEDESKSNGVPGKQNGLMATLPPLTSHDELDIELYALIAAIYRQFVQSWYSRFTKDPVFAEEVVRIIAHCTRGIEERMRHLDWEFLLLDELPGLLDEHIAAVDVVRDANRRADRNSCEIHSSQTLHLLRPHKALSPVPIDEATAIAQLENETDWCQILAGTILPLTLPPEDLSNPCLNVLVSEVIAELIIGNFVLRRLSEPWFVFEAINKVINSIFGSKTRGHKAVASPTIPSAQSEQTAKSQTGSAGLVAVPAAEHEASLLAVLLSYAMTISFHVRTIMMTMWQATRTHSAHFPERSAPRKRGKSSDAPPRTDRSDSPPSIIRLRIWSFVQRLVALRVRMPWLAGLLSLVQRLTTNNIGRTNGALDRIAAASIRTHLLNPSVLPPLLRAVRTAAFPNNTLAPARVPPSSEETLQLKLDCAAAIVDAIPDIARRYYFATDDTQLMRQEVVETLLNRFEDGYVNKHLVVAILELFIVRLFPESAERREDGYA